MDYNKETALNNNDTITLSALFNGLLSTLKHISVKKASSYIQTLPQVCRMHYNSLEHRKTRNANPQKMHPVKPKRGEIYNAFITEGVGSELCGNHLVLIVSNNKSNIYGEKVNIVPIEGDGSKINRNYLIQLTNEDMENGHLDKDPSRLVITDITTIDKARLDRRIGNIKEKYLLKINTMIQKQLCL